MILQLNKKGRHPFSFNCKNKIRQDSFFKGGGWNTIIKSGRLRAQAAEDRHGLCGGPQPEHADKQPCVLIKIDRIPFLGSGRPVEVA